MLGFYSKGIKSKILSKLTEWVSISTDWSINAKLKNYSFSGFF